MINLGSRDWYPACTVSVVQPLGCSPALSMKIVNQVYWIPEVFIFQCQIHEILHLFVVIIGISFSFIFLDWVATVLIYTPVFYSFVFYRLTSF